MTVTAKYGTEIANIANNKNATLTIKSMLTADSVEFPAFLTSFNQSFSSTWNEEEVYGRMDPIATFQNTKRSISIAFDLPCPDLGSAKHALSDCNKLAQFLYPGYTKQTGGAGQIISRPPLVSVKFANLISSGDGNSKSAQSGGLLGYLSGLEWAPVLDMGMFTSDDGGLYPKVVSLSFTLNVLHQGVKGFKEDNTFASNGFFGGTE
jgi:hypothetical protein